MKKFHWLQLVSLNLVVILCIFLPFIPGPYDNLSLGLSALAQVSGLIGLPLVPVGIFWLIQEIKKKTGQANPQSHWGSGYYYAITATFICALISLFILLVLLMMIGPSAIVIALLVMGFSLYKIWPTIKNLKNNKRTLFNVAPLYLLSIPLLAFSVRMFFIGPISDYSRNYAIEQGQGMIQAIENYYEKKNHYPESIECLHDTPKPSIMGIEEFQYARNGDAYNLSFVQWAHVFATKEVVMYNKNDEHNVIGHFASYDANQPHWRYYWLD